VDDAQVIERRPEPADTDETVALLELLIEVTGRVQAAAVEVASEFELSVTAMTVLWNLKPGSEPATMRALASRLYCDPSTISLVADKLESSGLVERRQHPTDGRKRTLALTDAGRELWSTLSRRLHETSVFAALDPAERGALAKSLAKAKNGSPRT
jgi:DNA-binding MarR family transcriptional regulator